MYGMSTEDALRLGLYGRMRREPLVIVGQGDNRREIREEDVVQQRRGAWLVVIGFLFLMSLPFLCSGCVCTNPAAKLQKYGK